MLFVSGLMGPYMAPIPANASAAMLFSFFVAVVVAPWLMLRLAPRTGARARPRSIAHGEGRLGALYRRIATPDHRARAESAWIFLIARRRRDARGLRAVRDQERHGQAAAVRQQVGTRGRRRPAGRREPRGHRAHAVRRRRDRAATAGSTLDPEPMPARPRRSISTAWCATTICASSRNSANCRSIWRRAASATAPATPSRSTCASG